MAKGVKCFNLTTQEMSESHWHEADPEIYTLCPECGDNGIQLILWWIKMTAREQKSGKMFGCWLLYHYRGYFCQLPWPGCAIVHFPCLWLLSFKFFPWISFHCTILAKSTLWKLKMWTVNSLTQWMALSQQSSHLLCLSEDIYQSPGHRSVTRGQEMLMGCCNAVTN